MGATVSSAIRRGAFDVTEGVRKLRSFERAALALVGGSAVAASFLDFSLWPLGWFAFAPILLAVGRRPSFREAFVVGVIAGLATNVPAFSWLVYTIHLFGGFPLWLSWLFYFGLSLYSAGQFVLFALAVRLTGLGPAAVFPALFWVMLEFFYPNLFPWRLANSQRNVPLLLQTGDLVGPFGLSSVMVWASAAIALAVSEGERAARLALSLVALSATALVAYGAVRLRSIAAVTAGSPMVRVGIVQGNLSIEEKHDVRFLEANIETYKALTESLRPTPDVVIWPESVISEPLPRTLRALSPAGREVLGLQRPLFAGALTFADD